MLFGLQKLTLLDYPGNVACTIFCSGCNFRCPFCHNPDLVFGESVASGFSFSEILSFLETRVKKLDGVCITGGEPLLFKETLQLAEYAHNLGYKVKVDTNGSRPEQLAEIVEGGYVDYIAMDIKNSPEKYEMTSGSKMLDQVRESVSYLLKSKIDYEFRTTVTGNLHEGSDFEEIGKWLTGAKRYFLQKYVDSGSVLNGDGAVFKVNNALMYKYQKIVQKYIPSVSVRGI